VDERPGSLTTGGADGKVHQGLARVRLGPVARRVRPRGPPLINAFGEWK
jgi:hypothetical protein